uniref:Uncharacterized protein n=1 Tax=Anguilla anguilla TaxID=7936 RepID=A0A0E9QQE0_ANGAN
MYYMHTVSMSKVQINQKWFYGERVSVMPPRKKHSTRFAH